MVDSTLTALKNGTFPGTKPKKDGYSSMHPSIEDGHLLSQYVLQQTPVCGGRDGQIFPRPNSRTQALFFVGFCLHA